MTTALKQEIIMLIISALLLAMIITLLILRIVTPDNLLVTSIVEGILFYWGLNSAYRYNPSNPSGTPTIAPPVTPQSQPAPPTGSKSV